MKPYIAIKKGRNKKLSDGLYSDGKKLYLQTIITLKKQKKSSKSIKVKYVVF